MQRSATGYRALSAAGGMATVALMATALATANADDVSGAVGPKELQHGMVIVSAFSQHLIEGIPVQGAAYEPTIAITMMRGAKERTCDMLLLGAMGVPRKIWRK